MVTTDHCYGGGVSGREGGVLVKLEEEAECVRGPYRVEWRG